VRGARRSLAGVRGHERRPRARPRRPRRARLDRQEHEHARPDPRLLLLHRDRAHDPRARDGRAGGGPLRDVHRLPRRVPDPGLRRALRTRRPPVHLLPHDRAPGPDRARAPSPRRGLGVRLRRLPDGVPVEPEGGAGNRSRPPPRRAARAARGVALSRRARLPPAVPGVRPQARAAERPSSQRGSRARQPPRPGGGARAPASAGRSRSRRSRRGGVGSRADHPRVRALALAIALLSSPNALGADAPLPGPYQQALHALQTDPIAAGRAQAAVALGQGFPTVQRPGADPRIVGALSESVRPDPEPTVRALAAYALCLLGDARGVPPLIDALRSHTAAGKDAQEYFDARVRVPRTYPYRALGF